MWLTHLRNNIGEGRGTHFFDLGTMEKTVISRAWATRPLASDGTRFLHCGLSDS